jgi:hypothetical protein
MNSTDECYWCIESACDAASLDDFMYVCEDIGTEEDTSIAQTQLAQSSKHATWPVEHQEGSLDSVLAFYTGFAAIVAGVSMAVAIFIARRREHRAQADFAMGPAVIGTPTALSMV